MPRDYTCQGDRFTEQVEAGEGPRTVLMLVSRTTGRKYARRVRTGECWFIDVRELRRRSAGLMQADVLEQLGGRVYWQPFERYAALLGEGQDLSDLPEAAPPFGIFLAFRLLPRGNPRRDGSRGRAVLLACPHCGRSVSRVYVSEHGAEGEAVLSLGNWRRDEAGELKAVRGGGVWGCVSCLGLTYSSRTQHKTPGGDGRLLQMGDPENWQKTRRGRARERALERLIRRCGGLLGDS